MMSDSPQKLGRNEWNAYMDKVKAKDREAFAFVFR
ncbi:RNA polymerase subunit sigma, partial [Vibrio parahaemolyticus]|nr:RNA polymerase subunit sigma [Vibrio parahaemolyticus]MDG2670320.1 RNA polymerase subunit sigma [Vibrio parahaemolyticus]